MNIFKIRKIYHGAVTQSYQKYSDLTIYRKKEQPSSTFSINVKKIPRYAKYLSVYEIYCYSVWTLNRFEKQIKNISYWDIHLSLQSCFCILGKIVDFFNNRRNDHYLFADPKTYTIFKTKRGQVGGGGHGSQTNHLNIARQ